MPEEIAAVLSEPRPGGAEQQELVALVTNGLMSRRRLDVTIIPHLYDLESDGPTVDFLHEIEGPMIVVSWLYPRAAFWSLKTVGIAGRLGNGSTESDAAERPIWCLGLYASVDPKTVLDDIDRILAGDGQEPTELATGPIEPVRRGEPTRDRWYPVIDRDRCTNCLECLNFCLFGVFGMDSADSILIEEPDACRAGCPACSRICPEGAIMFPQHDDPAIAGDAQASLDGLKLDLSQLFGDVEVGAVAASERDRALNQVQAEKETAGGDKLDNLVDELDDLDI